MKHDVFPDFLDEPVDDVAKQLLGCILERQFDDGQQVRVRIVETESYDQYDEASHSYNGQTTRNSTMFGPSGYLYVYFTYGMHYCSNVVTGPAGQGAAVLIRAVEPVEGRGLLEHRRDITGVNATNGPAKLCQALDINLTFKGHDLRARPLKLITATLWPGETIATSPRIGISKAKNIHRRYYIAGNAYLSR
jgi:DNA-3-methyladenine glycosylase